MPMYPVRVTHALCAKWLIWYARYLLVHSAGSCGDALSLLRCAVVNGACSTILDELAPYVESKGVSVRSDISTLMNSFVDRSSDVSVFHGVHPLCDTYNNRTEIIWPLDVTDKRDQEPSDDGLSLLT